MYAAAHGRLCRSLDRYSRKSSDEFIALRKSAGPGHLRKSFRKVIRSHSFIKGCVWRSMNSALYEGYLALLAEGRRKDATLILREFLRSFNNYEERELWSHTFLKNHA
jgi:hypothetical protein